MATIEFTDEAIDDLRRMDGAMLRQVLKRLTKLEENPELGRPLGVRTLGNLTTFRKLIVGNREWRIIY